MPDLTITEALQNSPFPTGATASSVAKDLDDIFDARATRLAKIRDQYDRKPPYNPKMLEEAGQSYRANVSTGEMEALIDNETAEATQGVLSATPIANFKSRGVPLGHQKDLGFAYHEFLHRASSFSLFDFSDKVHFETNAYGFAVATFPGTSDWRPRWQPHFEVRFDEDATPDVREVSVFAVHTKLKLEQLFEELEFDPEAVADGWHKGWNVPELRKFLVDQLYGNPSSPSETYYTNEYLNAAQALRDGTGWAATSTRWQKVQLTHLYARHPKTGKVAHYILTNEPPKVAQEEEGRVRQTQSSDANVPIQGPDSGILYYKEDEYDDPRHALWLMCYNLGPSTLASVRGLGYRAYTHTDLSNRFFSQVIDGGMMAASLLLQTPESDSDGRIPILRAGPITALPPGWQAVQNSFNPNFQHLVSLRDVSAATMHNNLGTYRRRPETTKPTQQTAAAVEAEVAQESEAKQNRSTYRTQAWTRLHQEIFRRVTKKAWLGGLSIDEFTELASEKGFDVEEVAKGMDSNITSQWKDVLSFYLNLLRYGFPLNLLFDVDWNVQSNRGFGAGSRSARLGAIRDVLPLANTLPKEKQDQLRHAYIVERTANPELADELFPAGQTASDSMTFLQVVMENNDMKEGREIPVPADIDHVVHFESHLAVYYQDIEQWKQDPNEVNTRELHALGRRLIPHLGSHLEYISRDPVTTARTDRMEEEFKRVIAVAQELQRVAQESVARNQESRDELAQQIEALRAQANDSQTKAQLRAMEIQNEFQLEQMRAEGLNRSRDIKTATQLENSMQKSQADEFRKMQSHQLEMQRKIDTLMADRERLQLQNEQLRQQNQNQG